MEIDWSKSPDWAEAHALYAFGGEISEVWVGKEKHQRLDQPKHFPYGGGIGDARHNPRRSQFRYETPRPAAWAGECLPPAGTELEAGFACEGFETWHRGVCIATGEDPEWREEFCVVRFGKTLAMYTTEGGRMRPIRTAEQISAEERAAAIENMWSVYWQPEPQTAKEALGLLWDAGYRKQVEP